MLFNWNSFSRNLRKRLFASLYLTWFKTIRFVFVTPYPVKPSVIGNWHQELLMDAYWAKILKKTGRQYVTIVSLHNDGEYAEVAVSASELQVIRGSTRRTEKDLYRNLLASFKDSYDPVFTLDGPLGPYHTIHTGALVFAKRNKIPIQIILSYPKRAIMFAKAWDRFLLPYPFTRIQCFVSDLFFYDEKLSLEENKQRLQEFAFHERVRFLTQIEKLDQLEKFVGKDEAEIFKSFKESQPKLYQG